MRGAWHSAFLLEAAALQAAEAQNDEQQQHLQNEEREGCELHAHAAEAPLDSGAPHMGRTVVRR